MTQNLELPESVYQRLLRAAQASGTTPAAWIATQLPDGGGTNGQKASLTEDQVRRANARLAQHIVYCEDAVGSDNEVIDADLAREYGDDHADLYRPRQGE